MDRTNYKIAMDLSSKLRRLASSCLVMEFRDKALTLLREMIPFNGASWGSASIGAVGISPTNLYLFEHSEEAVHSYLKVRDSDPLTFQLLGQPGVSKRYTINETGHNSRGGFGRHCDRSGIRSLASTFYSAGAFHCSFLTLLRSPTEGPFSQNELSMVQTASPILMEYWLMNHVWHLQAAECCNENSEVASAICTPSGILASDYPRFSALLQLDNLALSRRELPPAVVQAFHAGTEWAGAHISIRAVPIADMLLLFAERRPPTELLTAREREVVNYAARGLSYKAIANILSVSPSTIRAHLHNSYAKLGVRNKTELSVELNR